MYRIFVIFLLLITAGSAFAQKTKKDRKEEKRQRINMLIKQEEEGVIAYHKETAYGGKLINDGYGAFLEIGRARSVKKSLLYQFELAERKHPKEEKQSNPFLSGIPFIYAKQNFVYDVKIGLQQQMLLGNKTNKNGVSVTANFGGGINLGLLRPYYVQVVDAGNFRYVKYNSTDSALFLNNYDIAGGPGFEKGWGEIKVNTGIYAKAALRFDYGRYNEMVNALEVGVSATIYSKKLEQMVYVKQKQLFMNAYVTLMFGRRK